MPSDRDAVSVVLPTVEWTPACDAVAAGLRPGDELLVVCDAPDDPVAGAALPAADGDVEVLVAGEPEGCSGKANAVARGMEAASNDRFVWTDADFDREPDWLDRLVRAGMAHGPATAVPFFYGDGWWRANEVWLALLLTLPWYLGLGMWGDAVWGGGVTFTREDVAVDRLVSDLREVLSDDVLLSERLGGAHPVRSMVTSVPVPGDARSVRERSVRFNRIAYLYGGSALGVAFAAVPVAAAVLAPLPTAVAVTALGALGYAALGLRRWTFLLAYPAIVTLPLNVASGVVCAEFEWGGRRYRYEALDEVTVLEE